MAEKYPIGRKIRNTTDWISKSDHDKDINEIKNNYVTNSVLILRRESYVPYNDYNLKILLLEN